MHILSNDITKAEVRKPPKVHPRVQNTTTIISAKYDDQNISNDKSGLNAEIPSAA